MLFVPGSRPDRFAKAQASGADAVVFDLEDAVAPGAKQAALEEVVGWLAGRGRDVPAMVRVNAIDTPWHASEVEMLRGLDVALMLPKAETPEDVTALHRGAGGLAVVPLVETPRGVLRAEAIAAAAGVVRLALGHIDLAAALGVDPDCHEAFRHVRAQLVLAGAAAGLAAPIDGVTTTLGDPEPLGRDLKHALSLGFGAKLCIHPGQVEAVHAACRPTADQAAWAERVVAAVGSDGTAGGAIAVDGRMVDPPVVARAVALLARMG
ncbi:CoA ester lyase [Tsukamurella sp. PLM1]|uniref:HpcH/HpaI aldolase/citrate lyase family protein n=1 Tax=Tsukamurella sp. PLM1 TaxID=2929795 RepID=UPI0020C0EB67|nr:CoA ester lyase [Tsukamurella sp. PLM1]